MQIAVIIKGVKALALLIVLQIQKAIQQVKNAADNAIKGTSQNAQAQVLTLSEKIKKLKNDWQGMTGVQRGAKIAPYASMIGAGLSIAGSASSNLTAGTVMSGAGSIISGAASGLTMTGSWIGAGVGALVGVIKLISDLSSLEERKAEQKLEELKQAADEAENKRLESKQTVLGLEDYVKQYQEMAKAQYDSNDAKQQFLDLNAEIAEKYPDLLIQYDAEGNKIIQLTELQKKLNEEKANYAKANLDSIKKNYDKVQTERDNAKEDFDDAVLTASLNQLIDVSAHGDRNYFEKKWASQLEGMQGDEKEYFKGLYDALAEYTDPTERAKKASEYFDTDFGVQVLQHFIDNLAKEMPDSSYIFDIQDWVSDRNKYIAAEKKLKSDQLKGALSYMSSTFHYGDDTFEAYSPIYQSAKSAGFDLDQYIGNIMGSYDEETYKALIADEKEWAKRAQELANQFKEKILSDSNKASFVGDIQNKSKAEIDKFKEENKEVYEALLDDSWKDLAENLTKGIEGIMDIYSEGHFGGSFYTQLSSYVTSNNLSLWREIAENDAEHFEDYYNLVAELAKNNQFSIADITNTVLKADLSTMTGIAELRKTLKTKGAWSEDSEIESLLKQAESMVKFNPALEFAAMFDTYKKAYEELDKLASSLSTGLELKDAISWATKMGKSINEFTQKEGKFYVSQEQFWNYVNTQLPPLNDMINQTDEFYEKLEVNESGQIVGKEGSGIDANQLEIIQGLYDSWRNDKNKGDLATFIKEQKDNVSAEASSALKALLESYAIQSIQAFGRITEEVRGMLRGAGLTDDAINAMEDKYLGSETTSILFSTGKIDVANWDKLPKALQTYVNKTTGQITNYGKALEALATGIEEGTIDPSYASIYAEAVNSARSDLEDALEGTLDGARASTERVAKLIENGVLVLNKKTGKYGYDLSSITGYNQAMFDLHKLGYTTTQAIQKVTESALSQGTDVSKIQNPLFTSEYQYQLSQARQEAVEGLQNAVFDTTKSFDISTLYKNDTTISSKLDDLADKGAVRIEKDGEKVSLRILTTTIKNISSLIDTLAGGTDTSQNKASILATINSYLKSAQEGTLDRAVAEWLLAQLPDGTQFKEVFELTAGGYRAKNIQDLRTKIAEQTTELNKDITLTVSQFQSQLEDYLSAGYTLEQAIKALGVKVGTVADIIKGKFSSDNTAAHQYERVIYSTYQGAMNDIYSAMMDGLSNPVGAQIDLTKAKQLGGTAYDTLKEIMTVVETETGEAFGYFKDNTTTEVINMMRSLAIGGNSTVADLLAEYYKTIAQMITDGMNGDLSATNIEWLQKAFKLTDRMFVKAGTSFRLTEEGARRIYTTMNGIDAIAGNLSLSVFAKSLQEVDYKLQSVSAVSKEIVRLQEEITKAHGDKRKALENELALYQEILKVNQQNASSFNIMNNPIMGGAGNAIEAYKGLAQARQAIADMKTTNEYGMNAMDPTNAFRLAEISEQNLMALLKDGKNMVDVYAALGKSMRDIGGNFVIDMSNVASELEISFDNLGTAFGDGSNTALKKIAQVQVDMLDAQINMLEGIVAMEDLTIEKNNAGSINLDNWITVDKDGNIVDKAKQLGGMLGQVAKEVKGIENEVVTINQQTGENITFGNIIDALNSGKDGFETYLNSLPLEVREQVDVFINNILTELKKLDFNTVNTGEENLPTVSVITDMVRNVLGIKEDGTIDLGEGEEITPNIKVTIKTDGTSYYIEGDETPYADLTELGTALAAKLGVEGLTIPEDPFSQTIPMDSKPNVNITCSPEGKWFVNGAETTEENLPTAIRNAMSIDQQNIGTNNDTVYGNDDVQVKMKVAGAASYIVGNQEGDEESAKNALKESASLNNQSVGDDSSTLTGNINATVNTSIHFDGTNYTADGIDGTFDTKDKVADAIADKYKVDSRTLKEQIGKYNIPVNGSLDIRFQTITPSYVVNGESLGTYNEATDAIAAGYEIESKTLPEKTTDLDLPVNSTLDVSFQTVAPSYTVGDKVSSTFDEAADAIGTRAGIEDKKLDPKTITVTQDTIVNFKATLKDAEGNPIQEDNGLDTGIDVNIVPNLGGFSTALWELIQKQEYDVSISPVIANGMELGKAIQQAIDDRQYTVQINPTWPNHGGYTDGSTIQSFNPDGKKKSSSSTKSTNFTGVGSNVKEVNSANNLVLLDDALKTLASSFQTAATDAGTFSKGLEGIVPSSVALRASSAKSALVELGTTTSSTITDLTTIFNKIEELIKKLQEGLPTAAKGNVALAKGSNDALATGTLMGELGPELWVSGGHYYIAGQSGAEFVNLPDDAIVFNHLQTRSLLANGNTTRGRAIGGEDRAVAFVKGSPEGPARASASDTLERLKALRAVWQSLLDLPASDLSKKAGGGGGGGGAEDYKTFTADLERWYNLLRQIANYEQKITYEQKQRENFKHGQEYVDSLEKELKYLEKQADAYAVLSELQKSYYDQRRKDLNDTQYGKLIFTYTEDGLMQYLDDVVDANGNRQSRGLAILAELNRQSNEKGQSYWDKEGKNLYTGSFKVNGKQTIKGSSGGAAAQLMYLKSVGFDLNELLYNSEGGSNVGKNASETATNMMQTFFDNVDGWMEELDSLYDSYHEYLEKIEDNTAAQQKILQEYIDNQMSVEDKLLKAITDRQQKIIDTLKDQIDIIQEAGQEYTQGLSEALSKERNLYNENKDDAELASKMRRLGILKRTGASASEIKALQNEIDNQLQENYFDAQQKQIDAIQEAIDTQLETLNQQLEVMEEALNYQKENGLLWAEVYEMMTKWTPEAMLNFIETYTSSYRENSQQKNSEDSKETLKQLEIWAASRGFDFSREPHKGNSKDYTKPDTSNDVAAPNMPRPNGGMTAGGGTSGGSSGSGTTTMANGLAAPQEIDVENTGVYEDRTLTPTVRQVSKSDVIDIYKVGGYYTKKDGTHGKYAWEVNGKLPAGKYYDFNGEIYRNPGAKHRRIIYSATSGKVYYVYDKTYLPNAKKISSYSSGGMNYSTGMAMLHGTSSKPEAILNASDTKLFREKLFGNGDFSLRQAIATIDLLRDQIASTTNNNSSVDFNGVTINISSDVIANDYDAQRAGRNIFDEMIKLSRKSTMLGVSRR